MNFSNPLKVDQLFANPAYAGLLADEDQAKLKRQSLINAGLSILAASQGGQPGTGRAALFPALLQGLQAGQQAYTSGAEGLLKSQELKQKRMQEQQRKQLLGSLAPVSATQDALAGGGGPTVANAEKMQQAQGSNLARMMDAYRQALLLDDGGKTAEQIKKLIDLEKPQFKTQSVQELMVEGKAKKFAIGEDGTMRELGVAPEDLIQIDAGGQKLLVGKNTGQKIAEFGVTMTPSEAGNLRVAQGNLALRQREFDRPSYDFMTVDGKVVVGDKRTGQIAGQTGASTKDVQQVQGAANAIVEAANIIPKSTGSVVGRGADLALGAFGFGTAGAENTAKLEVIGAKLTANVPRFEGPQSNIDVQFYKQAAADVANPLKPASVRMEALRTAAGLIQKDAMSKGIPVPPEFEQFLSGSTQKETLPTNQGKFDRLPDPAQYAGRAMISDAGIKYRSNGKTWVKE